MAANIPQILINGLRQPHESFACLLLLFLDSIIALLFYFLLFTIHLIGFTFVLFFIFTFTLKHTIFSYLFYSVNFTSIFFKISLEFIS